MNENSDRIDLALRLLEKFNRKERYHLLRDAVVGNPFSLRDSFVEKINSTVDYPIPDKNNVYVAMDYHLDWIASAIHLVMHYEDVAKSVSRDEGSQGFNGEPNYLSGVRPNAQSRSRENQIVTGNQADVDLLVAYKRDNKLILVMIEAKLESGWDGRQLKDKGYRLQKIVESWSSIDWVVPRIVLAGPSAHEKAPNFSGSTLKECPGWFFDPPINDGGENGPTRKPSNSELRRINLTAKHPLYQPARTSEEGDFWRIAKTWPKDNGAKE